METLAASGYSAHLVGGCVRDSLMGRQPSDWDICTSALPEQVIAAFPHHKVLPTGIGHGTVTVMMDGNPVEITTLRRDGEYLDHRHPQTVEFTDSLKEDLARRDFTVNAMAYAPQEGLTDPFGGADDLKAGLLRCVGNPRQRFDEDALRILRLLRFASQLSFQPESDTLAAAAELAPLLEKVSVERTAAELNKLLLGEDVFHALCLAADHRIIEVIIPEFSPCMELQLDRRLFAAIAAAPPRLEIRLALLLHDIAKPQTLYQKGSGGCDDHAAVSAARAETILKRLRYPNSVVKRVEMLVRQHMVPLPVHKAALRRLCAEWGADVVRDWIAFRRANSLATDQVHEAEQCDAAAKLLDEMLAAGMPLRVEDLAVGGKELLEMGVPPGPMVGQILRFLLEMVLEQPELNQKEILLKEATLLWHRQSDS